MNAPRLGWSLLLALSFAITGCDRSDEKSRDSAGASKGAEKNGKGGGNELIAGGRATPEEALDAYVEALRKQDVKQFKNLFTFYKKRFEDTELLVNYDAKDKGAEGVEKAWKENLKFVADNEWTPGRYKMFPAEVVADKASILCAYDSAPALNEVRYRRYDFQKVRGSWYQTEWHVVRAADVDTSKYKWEKKQ